MTSVPNTGWTDDRVADLKRLWFKGLSGAQIAQQLGGVTRVAVVAKCNRLGLVGRDQPTTPDAVLARKTAPRLKAAAVKGGPVAKNGLNFRRAAGALTEIKGPMLMAADPDTPPPWRSEPGPTGVVSVLLPGLGGWCADPVLRRGDPAGAELAVLRSPSRRDGAQTCRLGTGGRSFSRCRSMSVAELDPIAEDCTDAADRHAERARPLRRAGVDAARRILIERLTRAGLKVLNPTIITEAICRAYVDGERSALRGEDGRWSDVTRRLAAMAVGDTIEVTSSRSTAHQRLKPARILMGNAAAVWTMKVDGNTVLVTRRPDGAVLEPRQWSPLVERLASMQVGDRVIAPEVGKSPDGYYHLNGYYKQAARKRIGEPEANWTGTNTNKGLRVERVR